MKYRYMLVLARVISNKGNRIIFARSTKFGVTAPMGVYGPWPHVKED